MSKSTITRRIVGTGAALAVTTGIGLVSAPSAQADVWDRVAACESGNNWSINTGNGYQGGLQFTQSTWRANGGSGSPSGASKAEQKRVARNTLKSQGPGAWPVCSRKAGLTRSNGGASSAVSSSARSYTPKKSYSQKSYSAQKSYSQKSYTQKSPTRSYTPRRSTGTYAQSHSYTPRRAYTGKTVTVRSGDTLAKLAARYNVSGGWQSMYRLNQGKVSNPNLIFVGQVLRVG